MIPKSILPFARLRSLREYQPISGPVPAPRFEFEDPDGNFDCGLWQVLYEPMTVLVDHQKPNVSAQARIHIYPDMRNRSATLRVEALNSFDTQDHKLTFYKVIGADLALAPWQRWYLKRTFGHSVRKGSNFLSTYDFKVYKQLAALFSFPKPVRLVSVPDHDAGKHFPIDLCAIVRQTAVLGVRNSNLAMQQLQTGAVFYLGDASAADYTQIYTLGKFNGSDNPTQTIAVGDCKVPAVISGYRKLQLQQRIGFENQTIYIASVLQEVTLNDKKPLFHLHKIWMVHHQKYVTVA